MLDLFKSMKIMPHEIEVKLFGGANVLQSINRLKTVGEKNIEMAHKVIQQYQLKVAAEDTGGNYGRTLYLFSQTGEVRIFTHKKSHQVKT